MDNITLFHLIYDLHGQSQVLDNLMFFGAEYLIYSAFGLIILLAFKGQISERKILLKSLLLILISLPVIVGIIKLIHVLYYLPRPFVDFDITPLISQKADASFPSRHVSIISAIVFVLAYYKSKWTPLFLFLMVWIGISRVYVGVHYPLDIIGGFLVGATSIIISLFIRKLILGLFFKSL